MAEDLERPFLDPKNFGREKIDLERLQLEEVFEQLETTLLGLTSEDAEIRTKIFGPNKLEENSGNAILKFLSFMWNPLAWVMEAAAVLAIVLGISGRGEGPDWLDFFWIIFLLILNSTISLFEGKKAGKAAAALTAQFAPKTKVLRDGKWKVEDASILVPGDIINIKLGDIIPADARLLEGGSLEIHQSAVTGESQTVSKRTGDQVYLGSTCKHGEIEAVVIATGVHSFFEKNSSHTVDSSKVGHFQQVLTCIGNFCICSVAVGMVFEIIVMFLVQHRSYRKVINNLLVLLIGGIPIAMPRVLSSILANGYDLLAQQGVITKRMTAIEAMAGMDNLCSDITTTLTWKRLTIDRNLIEVFDKDMDKDMVVLIAARSSTLDNRDAIGTAAINMLADPQEARANITEMHFVPFNYVDKRSVITYIDSDGNWYRACRGDPQKVLSLCEDKDEISGKVLTVVNKHGHLGMQSVGVALQEVPEKSKESQGGPWKFCGLIPLSDLSDPNSTDTINKARNLGVSVKISTANDLGLTIGPQLSLGTNTYPSSSLPLDEGKFIEADGVAYVLSDKYRIVKILQQTKHIVGMTGDSANDVLALKKADIGIAVTNATNAAKSASDIILTKPGLSLIIDAILISRAVFRNTKNYMIYVVSITIRTVLGFTLLALIWEFDFPPFMILVMVILTDGIMMTISQDQVKPSPTPDSWKLNEIFITGICFGTYLALVNVLFYWISSQTSFFETYFNVQSLPDYSEELSSAVYLQVSIISQALIFVTRSQSWSFLERPGTLLMCAFVVTQLVATLIAVYADIGFASISGIGWGRAGVIWLYSLIFYIPLDIIKFVLRSIF